MSKKGYFVPLELPKYCNKCCYGVCLYSKPWWSQGSLCRYDGQWNNANEHGYLCRIDMKNNNRQQVLRANLHEDIEKPNWCPLKEMEVDNA